MPLPDDSYSPSSSSSTSSSSDSDSELSDDRSNSDSYSQLRNRVQSVVKYFTDAQARYRLFRDQKIWQKLTLAIVDARLALLQEKWTDLLRAVKAIDDALATLPAYAKLQWRQPILNRLHADLARSIPLAMQKKRSMRAGEAKSLSILKQRLSKQRKDGLALSVDQLDQNPFVAEDTSFGDEIVLLSFELALLMSTAISKRHLLPLSGLNLTEVPLILQDLPNLATWYESFGGLEEAADIFDTLDLRRNHLTTLPMWLPNAIPKLRCLFVTNNPMTLTPAMTAFQDLALFDMDDQLYLATNSERLVQQALSSIQSGNTTVYIPPLALLCVEKLKKDGYELPSDSLSNIESHWNTKRYICASCKNAIFKDDPRSIHVPLRERYFHFEPPVTKLTNDGQFPSGTTRTGRILSCPEWIFCAPCLIKHCTGAVEDENVCMCIACTASRRAWQEKRAIRWTKLRVAI